MLRRIILGFGLVEIVAPRPVIAMCERIGLENPEEARLRTRAVELARLEGLLFVWLLIRGRDRSPVASALLAGAGLLAVFRPDPLIRASQLFAYENPGDLRLKPWVRPATRLLGALYLTVVVLSGSEPTRREKDADTRTGTRSDADTRTGTRTDADTRTGPVRSD